MGYIQSFCIYNPSKGMRAWLCVDFCTKQYGGYVHLYINTICGPEPPVHIYILVFYAHHLIMVCIRTKFRKNILYGFRVKERTLLQY